MVNGNWQYRKWGFLFLFLFLYYFVFKSFPKADAALWYVGTMAQNIRGEKIFQEQRKSRGNGKVRKELNESAKFWAILNAVLGV